VILLRRCHRLPCWRNRLAKLTAARDASQQSSRSMDNSPVLAAFDDLPESDAAAIEKCPGDDIQSVPVPASSIDLIEPTPCSECRRR